MNIDELKFIKLDEESNKNYVCPLCGGVIKVHDSVFYGRCDTCLATLIDYKPLPHQVAFHESKAQYRLNIGGYGTGKTTMDCAEVSAHALSVPNGKTLITAQTLQQVREAVLPELEKFLPPWFFAKKPTMSPLPKYTLTNGHEIIVYASNDEEKFRSLNLTAFLIVEASGVGLRIFEQLQSRLRNRAAVIKDSAGNEIEHKFMGIIETNPEEGWVRDEFLLRSSVIKSSKSVDIASYEKLKTKAPEAAYHSFLSATVDNTYLHRDFVANLCVGKNAKWIRKYIYCYLETKEGVVYPEFVDSIIDPKPLPKEWLRIYGFDKGWSDETCLVCAAIDPYTGTVYVYDEYYESQKPISFHAAKIKEKIFGYKMYKNIQADPSVRNRSDQTGVSYKDYFRNVSGIELDEANNSIQDGIERVRDFMYTGKLRFFTSCINIKQEAQDYVWKKNKDGTGTDDPIDRRNHLMDALRYLVMSLPFNPKEVYTMTSLIEATKDNLIDRIQPDTDISRLLEDTVDGAGGVYGLY